MTATCKILDCEKPTRRNCRHCQRHYRLLKQHGTIFCTELGCEEPIAILDKCTLHKTRRRAPLTGKQPKRLIATDPDYVRVAVKYSDDVIRQRDEILNKS